MKTDWKKPFAVIYAGQAFSIVGSAAVQFAIVWYLTVQTQSAITLTTAAIVAFLPTMFIGPFAGIWIDRYNRRSVMMLADGLVALSSAVLGVVFLVGTPPVWFIYIILFVRGLGSTFHGPAMQAAIPLLVPAEMLTKAGGWGNLINSAANMLGPVFGALLMGVAPIAAIMLVDIFGAVFAIVCLMFVRIPDVPRSQTEKQHPLDDMRQGLAALRQNRPLMAVFVPMILVNIVYMPLGSLFPLLVLDHFKGTAWHNGLVEFTFAAGLLVSSLVIGVWGGAKRRFLMISAAVVALGLCALGAGILPPTPAGFVVFVAGSFVMGTTGTFINVPLMAYTQETTAPEVMGKVFALLMSAMTLAMPIGLLLAGPVSEVIGVDRWFLYSGVVLALTGFLCWVLTRRYDSLPAAALAPAGEGEGPAPDGET